MIEMAGTSPAMTIPRERNERFAVTRAWAELLADETSSLPGAGVALSRHAGARAVRCRLYERHPKAANRVLVRARTFHRADLRDDAMVGRQGPGRATASGV